MQHVRQTKRARLRPGPLAAAAVAWLTLASATVRAHDPGLSVLEIGLGSGTVSASLSLASADVALIAPGQGPGARDGLEAIVRDAIRVSFDGETLRAADQRAWIDEGGVRVRMAFALRAPHSGTGRLTITSDVPKRLARGHRELLVVAAGGTEATQMLLDSEADTVSVDVDVRASAAGSSHGLRASAWSFLTLGNRHILSGYDHLLFLAGLFLAAVAVRDLIVLLTAFTLAHSISLALVVAAGIRMPPSIVEPLIAASIAYVGIENLVGAGHRRRWLVVFGFGLIHGFGFAGALTDLGLGSSALDVAVALCAFNVGVESGQLVVAAVMLPIVWAVRASPVWRSTVQPACSTLIAVAGGCWLLARLM